MDNIIPSDLPTVQRRKLDSLLEQDAALASSTANRWRDHDARSANATHRDQRVAALSTRPAEPERADLVPVSMTKLVQEIQKEVVPRIEEKGHPLLGRASLSIALIKGGVQINMVPDSCEIELDRRLLPGEIRDSVWQEFESVL